MKNFLVKKENKLSDNERWNFVVDRLRNSPPPVFSAVSGRRNLVDSNSPASPGLALNFRQTLRSNVARTSERAPNKLLIRATRSSPPRSNTPRLGFRSRFSSFHYSLAYLACTLPSPPSPPISIRNWCRFTRRKSIVSSRKIFIFAVSLKLANRSEILIPFPLGSVCFEHRLVSRSYFC